MLVCLQSNIGKQVSIQSLVFCITKLNVCSQLAVYKCSYHAASFCLVFFRFLPLLSLSKLLHETFEC